MTPRQPTPDFESRFLDLLTDNIDDLKKQVRKGFDHADTKINKLTWEVQMNTNTTEVIDQRLKKVETKIIKANPVGWWEDRKLITIVGLIVLLFLVGLFNILGWQLPSGLF